MIYSTLGKTGLRISKIGLGTVQLGGKAVINNRIVGKRDISKREANGILKYAYEQGINFYDTSDRYGDGRAEEILGRFFKKKRKRVYFATKCGINIEGKRNFSKRYIDKCIEDSLKRLQTDYIDVFQLTNPSSRIISRGEIFKTLRALKRTGKIRFSGISVINAKDGLEIIKNYGIDTIQVRYNLLDISAHEFIREAHRRNIGIIVKSPLSSGLLSGCYTRDTKFPTYDLRSKFLDKKELEKRLGKIENILKQFSISKKDLLHFSLKFLLSNSYISTLLIGNSRISQLRHNLDVLKGKLFNMKRLEGYVSFYKEDKWQS